MAVETPKVDTPVVPAENATQIAVQPTTDTPLEATSDSDHDEILGDIRSSVGATVSPKAEGEAEPTVEPGTEPVAKPTEPEPGVLMRDDYLKKLNALNEREAEIARREAAIAEPKSSSPAAPDPAAPVADPVVPSTPPVATPSALRTAWEADKAAIEARWAEYEDPRAADNEKALVKATDAIVAAHEAQQTALEARINQLEVQPKIERIAASATETSSEIKALYGLDVSPEQVLDILNSGAIRAYAAAKGKAVSDIPITKEVFLEAYEMVNMATLRNLRTAAVVEPAKEPAKPEVPSLHRGGGTSLPKPTMSDDDEILHDIGLSKARV